MAAPSGSPRRGASHGSRLPWTQVAWLTLLATAGCVQILGLHDRTESDSVVPEGGAPVAGECGALQHSSASCASCMDHSCCAQARACGSDPACQEASACLAACIDDGCRAQCAVFYSLPDTLVALRSCRAQQCAAPCGSSCGEFASAVPGCQACLDSSCCSEGTACASDTSCAELNLCVSNCFGPASCPANCQSTFPLGTTDFGTFLGCTNECATACQPGQSWACLDSPIRWPKPSGVGTITFSVTFVDFSAEAPYVGATVKACDKLDYACATPLAQSTTDTTGLVGVTVPAGLAGFDGYLDVSGGNDGDAGSDAPAFPALWYPVPFIVADGWRGKTEIPSTNELYALTQATGVTLDPTRGHFGLNAVDCAFTSAAGVSYSVDIADSKTVGYYFIGGVPVTTATATDQSGVGAFLNLPTTPPARLAVVKATSGVAAGKTMGSLSFVIRPGTFTTGSSYPPIP
jgi:hypothetical protein